MKVLLIGAFLFLSFQADAAVSPLGIAIFPPIEFPPEDFVIAGARISAIFGKHRNVYGLDLGVVGNVTMQNFVGLEVAGIFNSHLGPTTIIGLQAAGTNLNNGPTEIYGIQAALVNSNTATSTIGGIEVGILNLSPHTDTYGFQVGLFNQALNVHGFQIGLINDTSSLHGIQIGLVNIHEKGSVRISPILNIGI